MNVTREPHRSDPHTTLIWRGGVLLGALEQRGALFQPLDSCGRPLGAPVDALTAQQRVAEQPC